MTISTLGPKTPTTLVRPAFSLIVIPRRALTSSILLPPTVLRTLRRASLRRRPPIPLDSMDALLPLRVLPTPCSNVDFDALALT